MNLTSFQKLVLLAVSETGEGNAARIAFWFEYDGDQYLDEDVDVNSKPFIDRVRRALRRLEGEDLLISGMCYAEEYDARPTNLYTLTPAGYQAAKQLDLEISGTRLSFAVSITDLGLTVEQLDAIKPGLSQAVREVVHSMVAAAAAVA